jgi:hypothetical protein
MLLMKVGFQQLSRPCFYDYFLKVINQQQKK